MSISDKEYPIDDLGSPEDEEIKVEDLGSDDEEIPVIDLDAMDDDVSIDDLEALVEEVAVIDLDASEGDASSQDWASLIEEVAAQDQASGDAGASPGPTASASEVRDGEAASKGDEERQDEADREVHDLGAPGDDVQLRDLDASDDSEADVFDLTGTADKDEVLAEALAHAATLEAQYQQPLPATRKTGLWKAPLAMVVFVLAGFLVAFPPPWLQGDPLPELDVAARLHGVHASLYLQAQQVEAFRLEVGRLPVNISELDLTFDGLRFVRSNNRIYQLVLPGPEGTYVIFDSARPSPEVMDAPVGWGVDRP